MHFQERQEKSCLGSLFFPTHSKRQPNPIPRTSRGPTFRRVVPPNLMTQTHSRRTRQDPTRNLSSRATVMRLIVPLQGVVQGRGGLIWGSLIPCALFYFLQLYLKRRRPPPSSSNPPSPSQSSSNLTELQRSSSRSNLSSRGSIGRVRISSRASVAAKPNDSPYYIGRDKVKEDPYDRLSNPNGVIELGLAENKVIMFFIIIFGLVLSSNY